MRVILENNIFKQSSENEEIDNINLDILDAQGLWEHQQAYITKSDREGHSGLVLHVMLWHERQECMAKTLTEPMRKREHNINHITDVKYRMIYLKYSAEFELKGLIDVFASLVLVLCMGDVNQNLTMNSLK